MGTKIQQHSQKENLFHLHYLFKGKMQTALDFKKIIIFIMLATICVIRGAETVEEWEKLSKEEELELDRQLKLINKPAIKSFQVML